VADKEDSNWSSYFFSI